MARTLKPSPHGEFDITDINRLYMEAGDLSVEQMGRGHSLLNSGTPDSLLEAGEFVRTLQQRRGIQLARLEEIAFEMGFITADLARARRLAKTAYRPAILRAVEGR